MWIERGVIYCAGILDYHFRMEGYNPYRNKRVVVTGGAGFIGSHLTDVLLERGNRVTVFDNFSTGKYENLAHHNGNPHLQILTGDVRNLAVLHEAFKNAEIVFHLAVECVRLSLQRVLPNHEVNATGTLNALVAARDAGVQKFVYCSSSEVYGDALTKEEKGLSETSLKTPTTVYGASKLVGELYTLSFQKTYGLCTTVVRPFNAYGPRSHVTGPYGEVIPRFAILTRAGEPVCVFGDGKQTRDFTYVRDTAEAIVAASECPELNGDSINLAFGEEVSVLQIAEELARLHGCPPKIRFTSDRPGDIRRLACCTVKAKKYLSQVSCTPFIEGLKRYLHWLDSQPIDYPSFARALPERNWEL